jgi:hypothetical protein
MTIGSRLEIFLPSGTPSALWNGILDRTTHKVGRSIEDNVLTTCADLVQNVVLVGNYKPTVVLFVEPIEPICSPEDQDFLKAAVLQRTADVNPEHICTSRSAAPFRLFSFPP